MLRRHFIALSAAALTVAPGAALAVGTPYRPGLDLEKLADGRVVFLDFSATWCGTCAAQARVIEALMEENPAYAERIAFIHVDWDTYGRSDLVQRLRIPRRSTLVVLKGDEELGRIVAGTSRAQIKELMDTALAAAEQA